MSENRNHAELLVVEVEDVEEEGEIRKRSRGRKPYVDMYYHRSAP